MFEWSSLVIFLTAALVLVVTPGPAVLYIVARSVDQGRLAGIVSALGVAVGALFHIAAATLGISALLMSSALAFNVVKYLGAAYLIYLGIQKLREKPAAPDAPNLPAPRTLGRIFGQGVVVNLLNPKTALFFFAFLPQFANPAAGSVALQIALLGLMFITLAMLSDSVYALLAGSVGQWLKRSPRFLGAQRYLTGGVYIALGITTALAGSRGK